MYWNSGAGRGVGVGDGDRGNNDDYNKSIIKRNGKYDITGSMFWIAAEKWKSGGEGGGGRGEEAGVIKIIHFSSKLCI